MTREYRQHTFQAPAGATEILLVRHGESRAATAEHPFPLVDGQGDPELHANGRAQAVHVGERLRGEPIQAVYVTNLRRTSETAAPLCKHLDLEPIMEANLREVHLGEWEGGVMRMKAAENDPIYLSMREQERWDVIPGAESWDAINTRVMQGLRRIKQDHPDELVAAVLHGGIIAHIVAHASGARPFAFNSVDNGAISHIVMVDDQIMVRRFNDASHLLNTLHDGSGQLT